MDASRAALLGSHFERYKRRSANALVWTPPRFADLQPPSTPEILRTLGKNKPWSHRYNTCMANLASAHERTHHDVRAHLENHGARWDECRHDGDDGCDCCRTYQVCARRHCEDRAGAKSFIDGHLPVVHKDGISFDSDTWVTTASEDMDFPLVADYENAVNWVFYYAQPQNWAETSRHLAQDAKPFFTLTQPGNWKQGRFVALAAESAEVKVAAANGRAQSLRAGDPPPVTEIPWVQEDGPRRATLLKEVAEWDWSAQASGGSTVILRIKNFVLEPGRRLYFDYVLHNCEEYRAGGSYPDILDVDGGSYSAKVVPAEGGNGPFLHIEAVKAIHFTPPHNDPDVAVLLNMLAPATTSLFMRQISFEGTSKILLEHLGTPSPKT